MNFHQLHIFYTVAEKGSFSAAAQALHMTQPAVTMQIQSLEDYFGTKLLHRSTKNRIIRGGPDVITSCETECRAGQTDGRSDVGVYPDVTGPTPVGSQFNNRGICASTHARTICTSISGYFHRHESDEYNANYG